MPKLSSPKVWNLVAIIVLGGMATEQILGFRDNNPTALMVWISSAIAIGAVAWGLSNYKKPCNWFIPRLYAFATVPNLMLLFDAQSWTKFWGGLAGAVIFTLIISGFLAPYKDFHKSPKRK